MRGWTARNTTLAAALVLVVWYAFVAWQRRWIADDGLIAVRTVRELLGGHGPVFNAYERAEANTSTLWTYLLAAVAFVTRASVTRVAVFTGIALAIAGVAIGCHAGIRWHRGRGVTAALVPCGALILIGVTPFWDFASSGLETGLELCWIPLAWWLLVGPRPDRPLVAFVLGLGPLVRPDLGLASVTFLVAAWLLARPPMRRTFVLGAVAIALPLAYEVFRAGYYGVLVPLPALAKSASAANWPRGLHYLYEVVRPYWLGIPLAVLAGLAIGARPVGRDRILVAAPVIAGLLLALYVVRVGGDFMHARMLLPALLCVALPAFVVPVSWRTLPAVAVMVAWAFVFWVTADPRTTLLRGHTIEDERMGYCQFTHRAHPDDDAAYLHAVDYLRDKLAAARREHRTIAVTEGGTELPIDPRFPAAAIMGRLGTGTLLVPLDGVDADTLGLANPIGARIPVNWPTEPPGHQKLLPLAWIVADLGDPAHDDDIDPSIADVTAVKAARRAMRCGALAELLASVREPMSVSRFWRNLVGSPRRTRLVIPLEPVEAELEMCGSTSVATATASSAYTRDGWGTHAAVDGRTQSRPGALGWSSVGSATPHEEWIELALPRPLAIRAVKLYPRSDVPHTGFPRALRIETSEDGQLHARVTAADISAPDGPLVYPLGVTTDRVRIVGTELPLVGDDGYVFQLAEVELVR